MAWQQCAVWRPLREAKEGVRLPKLSGLGRNEVKSFGVQVKRGKEGGSDCPQ